MKNNLIFNHDQNEFLKIIDSLQIKDNTNPYFEEGLWPSYRYSRYFFFHVPDNNIFFSLSIIFLLKKILNDQNESQKALIGQMTELSLNRLEDYRNKDGKVTYNFWRTKPSFHFPHGKICQHFDYWRLPDDVDDTSLALLCRKTSEKELQEFTGHLSKHANINHKTIKKIDSKYQKYPAFSTFFGIKMPIEFDVAVISNALSVFFEYKLELSREAEASIELIEAMLIDKFILEKPFRASPNYARSSIIYYHLARMLHFYPHDSLKKIRSIIQKDLPKIKINDAFDLLLVKISSLLLGQKEPERTITFNQNEKHPFFIAGMLSAFQNSFSQAFAGFQFTHIKYHCAAYNYTLILLYRYLKLEE